jgi:hypothetical protein
MPDAGQLGSWSTMTTGLPRMASSISRSGTAWRFGTRGLLGQHRVGERIGYCIHEHLGHKSASITLDRYG